MTNIARNSFQAVSKQHLSSARTRPKRISSKLGSLRVPDVGFSPSPKGGGQRPLGTVLISPSPIYKNSQTFRISSAEARTTSRRALSTPVMRRVLLRMRADVSCTIGLQSHSPSRYWTGLARHAKFPGNAIRRASPREGIRGLPKKPVGLWANADMMEPMQQRTEEDRQNDRSAGRTMTKTDEAETTGHANRGVRRPRASY